MFLNYNGGVSFGEAVTRFTPTTISGGGVPMIAPFWADVDIRNDTPPPGPNPGTNLIWWDLDPATKTFTATWDDVGYYAGHNDKTNAFQLRLVGKDTPGPQRKRM
ncbi:MAG: nidogen-like domain-containing protein [Reyranella sp.]